MPLHPYAAFLSQVRKPAQYLGGERGEACKIWEDAECRICLAFPDLYEVGMSHLGYKILYGIVNGHPKLLAERAYAVELDMETQLRARRVPLCSLESARPLRDFDVVGFSLQFELTYTNVLQMLELGDIVRWSEARDEAAPLVLAGGPTATHAEPLAPFFDAMLIGDGEERLPELMLVWSSLRRAGLPRAERLRQLAKLEGVYVPSLYATQLDAETGMHYVSAALVPEAPLPVRRTWVRDLRRFPFPSQGPVAATETVFDRVSVEIARGCTEGCRFCQAGMIYRPVRERTPDDIVRAIAEAVRQGGYDEASLTSLSTADYSAIAPLVHTVIERLRGDDVALSVSSLRAYGLAEDVLDAMSETRSTGLTFAPEAGTQRMRDVVNKNVTEEQLLETAQRIFSRGWSKMKLYFMIGLPTEEDEDVIGIVETGLRALRVARSAQRGEGKQPTPEAASSAAPQRKQRRAEVTVSVSTHVPKPHTPFQWCAMDNQAEIDRKQLLLRRAARRTGLHLRLHDAAGSWLEGVLARGDRRLAAVIAAAYDGGARFDSWSEHLKLDVWRQAFAAHGIVPQDWLGTLPLSARLPWDHLDVGLEDGFLAREYRKALRGRLSPPCGKAVGMFVHHANLQDAQADARKLVCYDCGVACDLGQMRQERQEFLHQLSAETPQRSTPPPVAAAAPLRIPRHPAEKALRLRLRFTKLGRLAYRSHLDLLRLLPRTLRSAGLPLQYSQGFHPKPELSFGPALSVGIFSLCELVDVSLRQADCGVWRAMQSADLLAKLNTQGCEGLRFVEAEWLADGAANASKSITAATYIAALAAPALSELGIDGAAALQARFDARLSLGSLQVRRDIAGIGKQVDVGAYLQGIRAGVGGAALSAAGLQGALLPIELRLRLDSQGTARPSEVIEVLLGPGVQAQFVRSHLDCLPPGGVAPAASNFFSKADELHRSVA